MDKSSTLSHRALLFMAAVLVAAPSALAAAELSSPIITIYNGLTVAYGGLLQFPNGALCGTTAAGPTSGTVYELFPPAMPGGPWTKSTLLTFDGTNGARPMSSLIMDKSGNLYGTVTKGTSSPRNGGVFELIPPATAAGAWTEKILYAFAGQPDGSGPMGGLVFGPKGELYGTTTLGGAYGLGTVFELMPPATSDGTWTESVLYSFGFQPNDGAGPISGLIIDRHGNLYGTNDAAVGLSATGTVFELSPPASPNAAWTETVLWNGVPADLGFFPVGPVAMDANGSLYGTTFAGASGSCSAGCGTVFQLTPPAAAGGPWAATVLHSFQGSPADAGQPYSGVLIGPGGVLYGTTEFGGTGDYGAIYWLAPPASAGGTWTETVVSLSLTDEYPLAGLILGKNGIIYGNTQSLVYALKP
jgi:uncharacterized repeat protein (TIGR03803 family)